MRTVLFVLLLSVGVAYGQEFRRAENTLDDVFAASCRVNVSGARGSGTFNGVKDGLAYISTNYHVVSNQKTATVDFWTNGVKQTVVGKVAWRAYDANMPADFAFIVVDAAELAKINPPYVALGGSDAKPSTNSFFLSSGGPKGLSVKAWKGKVLDYFNGETALFQPHPVPGQSGSGVFEEIDGELFQVGIITWLIGSEGADDSKGGAIPIANLYKALRSHPFQVSAPNDNGSPIPPGAVECVDQIEELIPLGDVGTGDAGKANAQLPTDFATRNARVLYFTGKDCPACKAVEGNLPAIQAEVPVEIIDTDSEIGLARATAYEVASIPMALIVDADDHEVARVEFEKMKDPNAIVAAFKKVKESIKPATLPAVDDFRKRPAHYETAPMGFFEDSEDRWQGRGRLRDKLDEPDKSDEPTDLSKDESRLEKRVRGVIEKAIQNSVDDAEARFDGYVKRIKRAVVWAMFLTFLAALIVFHTAKQLLVVVWNKIATFVKAYREFAQKQR